jgi:hypothetical protein
MALPGGHCCCLCFKQTIGPAYRDLPGLESFAALLLQPGKPNTGGASPATGRPWVSLQPPRTRVTIIYRVLPSLIGPRTQGTPVLSMRESLLRGCDEGPESRLAEMDSGRKNCRRVYRVRDEQHGPGPAPSQPRVVSGQRSTCNRSRLIVLEDADMGIVIGPVPRDRSDHGLPRRRRSRACAGCWGNRLPEQAF